MKRFTKTIRSCLILTAVCLLVLSQLSACSKLNKLSYDGDGRYTDKKTGVTYVAANGAYEPASIGEDYATLGENTLSGIAKLDPQKWLCERKTLNVFHSEDITLPTFEEMTVKEIKICVQDVYTVQIETVTAAEDIASIKDTYYNGERGLGFPGVAENTVVLKVVFEECPDVYYSLVYTYDSEGKAFLSNRYDGKIVVADGLLDKYLGDGTETE